MNIFYKIFQAIKNFISRPGFKTFIGKYEVKAVELIGELAQVNSNKGFHEWKDQAFTQLKLETNSLRDNWISILIHLAYEQYLTQKLAEGDNLKTGPLAEQG